jgi:hypothetical protein
LPATAGKNPITVTFYSAATIQALNVINMETFEKSMN